MYKAILITLLIFLIPYAYSGNTHYLDFSGFTNATKEIIVANERDIIRINTTVREYELPKNEQDAIKYLNKEAEQAVMIRAVNDNKNKADITIFVEGANTPSYATIDPFIKLKLDFERDEIDDIFVKLIDVQGKKVKLQFEKNLEKGEPNLRFLMRQSEKGNNIDNRNKIDIKSIFDTIKGNLIIVVIIVIIIAALIVNKRLIKRAIRRVKRRMRK